MRLLGTQPTSHPTTQRVLVLQAWLLSARPQHARGAHSGGMRGQSKLVMVMMLFHHSGDV
jgi:hypothetical protein